MSRPFPPELQALLDKAKELGIEVQMFGGGENKPKENDICPCPVCSKRRARAAAQPESSFAPGEKGNGETGPAQGFTAAMAHLDKITAELANHITKVIEAVDGRSLVRDQELRANLDTVATRQSDLKRRIDNQDATILALTESVRLNTIQAQRMKDENAELAEIVRRQVGLLHKRVTKRKAAIAKVARKTRTKIEA